MTLFQWDSVKYDVGVEAMNGEHRGIVSAMNRVYDLAEGNAQKALIRSALAALERCTVEHFAHEEAFMESVGYPGLASHKRVHAQLLANLSSHVQDFEKGAGKPSPQLFEFLKLWLSSHIQHIDVRYGQHAQGARATGT
jgi:hemerythrin